MAKKTTKRRYLKELDRLSPQIRRAYLTWVSQRVGLANVGEVESLVASGNVEGIMKALDITEASLGEFTESVRNAYKSGGTFEAPAAGITFNVRSVGAESWIGKNSGRLVRGITSSQQESIQVVLENGIRTGTNPRITALDIVGTKGVNKKRTGGIIGLSGAQSQWVTNARRQLRSGDPAEMAAYLERARRDRRYDGAVRRAIREGRPLTVAETKKITERYADRLLKLRGETIARTESTAAFNAARDQAWQQSVDEGKVSPDQIINTWSATLDSRTRDAHAAMNGQRRKQGQPFNSPTGAMMLYPGDTSYGAGAEDVINCRCFLKKEIDFIAEAAAGF